MDHFWTVHGPFLDCACTFSGPVIWKMTGLCMDLFWTVHGPGTMAGLVMDHVRTVHCTALHLGREVSICICCTSILTNNDACTPAPHQTHPQHFKVDGGVSEADCHVNQEAHLYSEEGHRQFACVHGHPGAPGARVHTQVHVCAQGNGSCVQFACLERVRACVYARVRVQMCKHKNCCEVVWTR